VEKSNDTKTFYAFCDTCGTLLASEQPLPSGHNAIGKKIVKGKVYCEKHEAKHSTH
jgi:hypothetical protein